MKILLGIQPTGRLHIGNYFGAIKKGFEMQKEGDIQLKEYFEKNIGGKYDGYHVQFMVANYHANAKNKDIDGMFRMLFSIGARNIIEQKEETLELFYKLAHSTSVSELARLPQYQTKEQTLHILSYPLLMACDIIISECDGVIVGDDQEPHMHFYREIARRNGYKEAITIKSDTPRIMSISDPSKKMSKSLGDTHCIYLDDSREELTNKIMKAPTTVEGIENLKSISSLYGFEYNEDKNKESKEGLIESILSYKY